MKKILISLIFVFSLTIAFNYASAQETSIASAAEKQMTAADLGVADPGILPTSRFYFMKNWGRSIQRTLTFNPVKKAELELDIINQQAAEIAKIKEIAPNRVDALVKVGQNYQDNVDRLKNRFEALKDTSQNPNIDKLMDKFVDRSIKHQQLFDEFKQKFENEPRLKQNLEKMQDKASEALIKIPEKFDTPGAFKARMVKAIEAQPNTPFKEFRGMEIIERIENKLPESMQEGFRSAEDDLMKRFEEVVNSMPEEEQKKFLSPAVLEKLPGDPLLRARVLEQMTGRITVLPAINEQINTTRSRILNKVVEKGEITKEKADEQIMRAYKAAILIDKPAPGITLTPDVMARKKIISANVMKYIDEAKSAFKAGKYVEAFERATSAEIIARGTTGSKYSSETVPVVMPPLIMVPPKPIPTPKPLQVDTFPISTSTTPTSTNITVPPTPIKYR